jgi:cytochrome c peroxidase
MRPGRAFPRFCPPLLVFLALAGCQPADRYPPVPPAAVKQEEPPARVPPGWGWQEPDRRIRDVAIVFVPSTSREWETLPSFWNHFVPGAVGVRTIWLGLPALNAAAAALAADRTEVVKIKVPLGLPDPTPNIPSANPVTLGKWRLGQKLFLEKLLSFSGDQLACASCHNPQKGFANDWPLWQDLDRNAPTLINVVYNRRQFWDGRVRHLEEVVVRSLKDESPEKGDGKDPKIRHVWGGLVQQLDKSDAYREEFRQVFGGRPTQDNVAKALATYMRTILSGKSLFDRAEQERKEQKETDLRAEHFEAFLNSTKLKALGAESGKVKETAQELEKGYRLFRGQARCDRCHQGALFTDHDFHNTGVELFPHPGEGAGRFDHLPPGLKEARLIGAFRTPTLRALPRTAPYLHDGRFNRLEQVIDYYDKEIDFNRHLDPLLRQAPSESRKLNLSAEEKRALVLFLRALDGEPVDPVVARPPAEKK